MQAIKCNACKVLFNMDEAGKVTVVSHSGNTNLFIDFPNVLKKQTVLLICPKCGTVKALVPEA